MQLNHVTVRQRILAPDMVPIHYGFAPYASVLERAREVLVHEARDRVHGLAATQGKRPALPGCVTRSLGIDTYDTEVAEQPGANFPQAPPGGCRHGQCGIVKPRDLQERPELGVRVGEAVRLVGDEQGGKP